MSNCINLDNTVKAPNGEQSILYDKLYMITKDHKSTEKLYSYFKTKELKDVFGDYERLLDNSTDELSNVLYNLYQGRIDENGEPALFYDDYFNFYYFKDIYGNRVYYPLQVNKITNFSTEEIKNIVEGFGFDFIKSFEFNEDLVEFINKNNLTLRQFVKNQLEDSIIKLKNSDDIEQEILGEELEDTKEVYLDEWVNRTNSYLKRLKLNLKVNEEYIEGTEESGKETELIRKESFETDFKDNVNNNIKLMLSIIPSGKINNLGNSVPLRFEEVYTNLLEKLSEITQLENEDKFSLFIDEVKKLVKIKPQYRHLIEPTEENNYLPLFSQERSKEFKRQVINAFDLVKKNHLQSEVESKDGKIVHTFKNISEISNRKNITIKEWDSNLKENNLTNSELKRFSKEIINPLITDINKNKDKYKSIDEFIKAYNYKIKQVFDKLGIEYSKPSLKYYLNNNSLEELNIESNISKYVKLLNSLNYFIKLKADTFKEQSNIMELAEAHAFFQERTSDSSVNTMGKNKWVYGNRTYLETSINQWIKNPDILEAKLNEDGDIQSGSTYIPYLLGYVNEQGKDQGIETKEERHKLASERLKALKVFYFNGIQAKGDNKNSSDSKNISRSDIILDNVNKLLSFKVGLNPTSKTSLASDKSSAIELQYNYSINADLMKINGKNSFSNQAIKTIFKYVDAEYRRIGKVAEEIENLEKEELISSYHTGPKNGLKFFTIKDLNDPSKIGLELFNNKGKPLFKSLADNPAIKERIEEFITDSITKEIENIKEKLLENNILKKDLNGNIINNNINSSIYKYYIKEKGSNAIDSLISDYFVNSYVSQVEYHNLFTGDMAYYKNPVDYIKRVSSSYTDGQYLSNFDEQIYFNVAVVDSIEIDPINIDKIQNKEIRELYRNTNAADAQSLITPNRWKFIKQGLGQWTSIEKVIWKKMSDENAEFTNEELKKIAQPLKGVHFELKDGKVPIYLKYSQAVLVPSLIKNMPELKAIYDRMNDPNNRIDELLTKDAIKVGSNKISTIHNTEGGVINLDQLQTTQLQNKFWKLQQDLPTKGFKNLKLGSQIKEIILQGLLVANNKTKFSLPGDTNTYNKDEFLGIVDSVLSKKSDLGVQKLKNILGIDENFKIQNKELLYKKILNQLEQRDIDQNTIDALQMGVSPYGIPGSAELFQNVFSTLLNGETVDIKTNGGSFIQMADFGFNFNQLNTKSKNKENGIILTPAGAKAIENKESKLHMPEVYKDENGNKKVRPGGVFLSGSLIAQHIPNYKEFTTEELFGKNGLVDSKILESIIGYRIPNQSLASNDAFEILGFLPETMGDTIVPYTGFTSKTGSDFDIDKLYLMIPSFRVQHTKETIFKLKNKIKQQIDFKELKEELINQGYTKDSLNIKSDVYNYFIEDIIVNNFPIYNESIKSTYDHLLDSIKNKKTKLKYVEPLTIEDLKEGNIKENSNYGNALNNLLLNTYKSILTNPDVYNEMINPIDIPFMQENIESLAPPQEREGMNYFNSFEDAYTRLEYMEGKKGLGIIINQMMDSIRGGFNPVSHNLNLSNTNKILDNEKSNTLTEVDIDNYTTFYNTFVKEFNKNNPEATPKKELTKEKIKKIKSLNLKDSMTALVNAFVDIAKDPYVFRGNWNTTTTNLGSMLLRMGMHPFIVNSFLSNKTIKNYIEFSNLNNSITNKGSKNNFLKYILTQKVKENITKDTNKNIITIKGRELDMTNTLLDIITTDSGLLNNLDVSKNIAVENLKKAFYRYKDKFLNDYEDDTFIKENVIEIFNKTRLIISSDFNTLKAFHKKKKKAALKKGNSYLNLTSLLENLNEPNNYDLLYLYDKLQNTSDKLSLNVKSNSYRVNGKSKNITSTFVAKNLVLKAANKSNFYTPFNNYMNRFNEVEGYQNNLKSVFKNSIEFPIKIMQNNPELFLSGSMNAAKTFNLIAKLSNDNGLLTNQDLADKLERSYLTYIMSGFKPFKTENPSKFIEEFNNEFKEVKKKLSKNVLLKELNIKDEIIQANGTKKLTHYKNELTDAWKELEDQFPKFSENLAKYSYLTSGFFTGPTTFFQFIPIGFYNKNYFNAYLNKKINNLNNNESNRYKNDFDLNFIKQFAENNFDYSYIVGNNKLISKGEYANFIGNKKSKLKIKDLKKKKGIINIYNYNIDNQLEEGYTTDFIDFINSLQTENDQNNIFDESSLTNYPIFPDVEYQEETQSQEKPEILPEYQEETEVNKEESSLNIDKISNDQKSFSEIEKVSYMIMNKLFTKEGHFYKKDSYKAKENYFYASKESIYYKVEKEIVQNIFKYYNSLESINNKTNSEILKSLEEKIIELEKIKEEKYNIRETILQELYTNRRLIQDFSKRSKNDINKYSENNQNIIKKYFNKLFKENNYKTDKQALFHQTQLALKKVNREINFQENNKSFLGVNAIIKKLKVTSDFIEIIPNWRNLIENKITNEYERRLEYKTKNLEKNPELQKTIDFRDLWNQNNFYKQSLNFEKEFTYLTEHKKNIKKVFKDYDSSKEVMATSDSVEVLKNISNNNSKYSELANSLINFAEKNNVKINVLNSHKENSAGNYTTKIGQITDKEGNPKASFVKNQIITIDGTSKRFAVNPEQLVLHEIVHSLSTIMIASESHYKKGNDIFNKYLEYLKKQSMLLRDSSSRFEFMNQPYAFKNASELFTEALTNPEFRDLLRYIPPIDSKYYNNFLEEFLDKVFEYISKVFKKDSNYNNALEQLEDLIYNTMEAQSNMPLDLESVLNSLEGDIKNYKVKETLINKDQNILERNNNCK